MRHIFAHDVVRVQTKDREQIYDRHGYLLSFALVENRTQLPIALGFTLAHGHNQASYVITGKGTCPNLVGI